MPQVAQSDTDPHSLVLTGILALILVAIVGFLLYGAFERNGFRRSPAGRSCCYYLSLDLVWCG